jgi:hypothetical protein
VHRRTYVPSSATPEVRWLRRSASVCDPRHGITVVRAVSCANSYQRSTGLTPRGTQKCTVPTTVRRGFTTGDSIQSQRPLASCPAAGSFQTLNWGVLAETVAHRPSCREPRSGQLADINRRWNQMLSTKKIIGLGTVACVVALLGLLAAASPARASDAFLTPSVANYSAAPGEKNQVTITGSGRPVPSSDFFSGVVPPRSRSAT